jgi:hypothetical protein
MGSISWAARRTGEAAKKGGKALEGVSESLKEASENVNYLLVSMSPKLEQAVLAACISYFSQALIFVIRRPRKKLQLFHNITIVSCALAILLEVVKAPLLVIPGVVGSVSALLTYLEMNDVDDKKF